MLLARLPKCVAHSHKPQSTVRVCVTSSDHEKVPSIIETNFGKYRGELERGGE